MKTFEEYITEGLKITLGPAKFEQEAADKVEEVWHGLGKHNGKFSIFVNHKKKIVQIANWGASGGAKDAVEIGKAAKKEWKGYKVLQEANEEYITEAKTIKLGPAVFKLTDTEQYKGETIEYYDNTGKYPEAFSLHVNHKDKTVSVYQNMGDEYQSSEEWMDDWFKKKGLTKKYDDAQDNDPREAAKYQKMFDKAIWDPITSVAKREWKGYKVSQEA